MNTKDTFLEDHEQALIKRASCGDHKAFSELFYAYKDMVYRVVYRLLGSSEEANDAVQQTFIELYKSLPGYEGKSKFTTWLYRIATNVSIQTFRKKKHHQRKQNLDPELLYYNEIPTEIPGERSELKAKLEEAIASLHIRKRTVVVLHDIENRTMEEISEITGVPIGTIKSRLFYGRNELKKKLEKVLNS